MRLMKPLVNMAFAPINPTNQPHVRYGVEVGGIAAFRACGRDR